MGLSTFLDNLAVRRAERRALSISTLKEINGYAAAPVLSGVKVDPDVALTFAAVFAAVNVIATDASMLPLRAYRRRPGGGRDPAPDHPVDRLFRTSPDGETTSIRWRQALFGHVLSWGNGYAEILFDGQGRPRSMHLLSPRSTKPERRPQDNHLFYRLENSSTLPPRRVFHLAGLGYNGLTGYSPIGLARQAIGLGLAAEQYGAAFFGNSARPSGILKTPHVLKPEARANMRESWTATHGGPGKAGGTAILEQGTEFQPIGIPPDDAQFLVTRQFQVVEIARIFRLPPHKIGDYTQSHLANIEASNIDYLTTALMPWLEAIEQEIGLKLFTEEEREAGYYVEHTVNALLRGDVKSRFAAYETAKRNGWVNTNEVRELENMNPIPDEDGGNTYMVQAQMVPLGDVGKEPTVPEQASQADPNPAEGVRSAPSANGHTTEIEALS